MSTPTEAFPGGLKLVPVAAVIPCLKMLLISTIFSSSLIPTAVVLFVFSTPALRRRPNFILNLCAIVLGLTQGVIYIYVTINELVLTQPSPTLISVITALCIVGPICVQTILFLRVLVVYPPQQQSVPVRVGMYGPALAMKVARVANACCLIYAVQRDTENIPKTIGGQSAAVWASPFAKSELFLQLVDDVYISTLFLLKIHAGVKFSGKQLRRNSKESRVTLSQGSYAARLRMLFWIALSNFVFPVIFDIAQLILIFRDPDYMGGSYVVTVNSYISILGVLFSTIWASGSNRMGEGPSTDYGIRSHTNPYSTSITAGHLPLPPKPTHLNPNGSLSVPPELKVRFSSRSELDTTSGETDSSDEHRFIAQPRIEFAIRHHPFMRPLSPILSLADDSGKCEC
ncbi:hypothetical protein LXA43DRAFT_1098606 [Ganoderma leucocontextum]|nr:hypothetical protein LXA43DRAFT_1098606 [Ganoderma leucocontextum]